ncbi:magnesium transporter [Bacillus lacus]|uniref:Magnesium transporter MgtE n=1 Tax=Metabacillus lacus TaxID=1983721 RepID=A0A7X2J1P4_9BACI|nr:magnesium transporter [Metabacillus lacus]MRX73706.1 magnesium transporter [Metabacillus lacus]
MLLVKDDILTDEGELAVKALHEENLHEFRRHYLEHHPYDQARLFILLSAKEREMLYQYLSPGEMAEIFENIEEEEHPYETYLAEMNPSFAADMFAEMYTDDAVDVLNELDKAQAASYLSLMNKKAASEIRELLHYEESTAGSIMTTEFITISAQQNVGAAMEILKAEAPDAETIYYIYVTDGDKKLAGVVSLRDLIISSDHTLISDIMNERVYSVSVADDQEDVARRMRDYNFLALPVVDFQQHILGIITVDDIVDVIDEEASEDYSRLAAVPDVDTADRGPFSAAKKRLPWLIILLFLGMLTASLIGRFEATLEQVAILAVFIPLIAGMAGNTGTQALAVAVRRIALGDTTEEKKSKILLKEAGTGLITGTICGIVVTITVFIWHGQIFLGLLVGISIFATLTVATVAGAFIPLLMHKFNIDPAVASGPFITTINDIISVLIYFGMATMFMQYLL